MLTACWTQLFAAPIPQEQYLHLGRALGHLAASEW